jgi:hypothetical protein
MKSQMIWLIPLLRKRENPTSQPRKSGTNYHCKGTSIGDGGPKESRKESKTLGKEHGTQRIAP